MAISPLGVIILIVVLVVLAKGLANPIMRPFLIFLVVALGLFAAFFAVSSKRTMVARKDASIVTQQKETTERLQPQASDRDEVAVTTPTEEPAPAPPKRSKIGVVAALAQAIGKAWHDHVTPPSTSTAAVAAAKPATAEREESTPRPKPPAWVNAAPRMQDDVYLMDVPVGPYTSLLECEAELPKVLQAAVAEYAELSFGRDLAKEVHLPDEMLRELISERWTETRPLDLGGTHEMVSLHVLAAFDAKMKERILDAAERGTVTKRLQGACVIFSGLLGLLVLAWGGLRLASK